MVESCSALNCVSRRSKGVRMKFHRIPKVPEMRKLWLHSIGRVNYNPSASSVICEKHFTSEDYEVNVYGNRVLKKTAVPTAFYPNHLKEELEQRRVLEIKPEDTISNRCNDRGHISPLADETLDIEEVVENPKNIELRVKNLFEVGPSNLEDKKDSSESCQPMTEKKCKMSRRREPVFFGDFQYSDLDDIQRRNRFWKIAQETLYKNKKVIKYNQCKIRRQSQKITDLKSLLNELLKGKKISSTQALVLKEIHDDDEEDPIQGDNISNTGEPQSKISKPNVELEKTLIEEEENPELRTFCDFIYQKMNSFDEATYNLVQHEIMQVISQAEETKFCNDIEISETNESFPSDIDIEHCKLEPEDIDETDICKYEIDIDESDSCMYTCKLETEEKVEGT